MNANLPKKLPRLRLPVAVALTTLFILTACASGPPVPTEKLQAAKLAIATAEGVDAARHAPGDLSEARTKLSSADTAVKEEKMLLAEQYAEQARVDAELATARTAAAKAKAVNDEMKKSTGTLIEEMQRKSGGTT